MSGVVVIGTTGNQPNPSFIFLAFPGRFYVMSCLRDSGREGGKGERGVREGREGGSKTREGREAREAREGRAKMEIEPELSMT